MSIAQTKDRVVQKLQTCGFDPITSDKLDQAGDYLIFEEQILQPQPKPDLAIFAFTIARSDLDSAAGAYSAIDALYEQNDAIQTGIKIRGAKLFAYEDSLYKYRARIEVVIPKI